MMSPSGIPHSPRRLLVALSCVLALVALFTPPSIVGARSGDGRGVVEARNLLSAAAGVPGARLVHTATAANIALNWTEIDHPLTNGNPNAIVLVTQNYNPGGSSGKYNDHAVGVWYNNNTKKWAIFNQDLASMPIGADFNVLIPTYMYTPSDADAFVHEATVANITLSWTEIDHPLLNDNPDAIMLVTQNYNPGGGSGQYNNHAIGVWYRNSTKRWAIFNQDKASMPIGADFNILIPPTSDDTFVHTATAANIESNWTEIDHPLTNDNPNAMVLVTQNFNPGGGFGIYNDHAIGVWYRNSTKRWAIFNQDKASMPTKANFNVLIPATDSAAFVEMVIADDLSWTSFYHPLTNDNPNAILFVTQNWNPGGTGGVTNDHPVGAFYKNGTDLWGIFNQDQALMERGAAFNVLVPPVDTSVFLHTTTAVNITSNWTGIDHPLSNNNPDAILLVTSNWNPGGGAGQYNDHAIGVWYDSSTKKWAIFNQDLASMPVGAVFNVMVLAAGADTFVHTATASSITSNWTEIDHPLSNYNADAIVLVTQNWNPGGSGGLYNDHAIGVWYRRATKKWAIFNQDKASMPVGACFNVIVVPRHRHFLPMVLRGG